METRANRTDAPAGRRAQGLTARADIFARAKRELSAVFSSLGGVSPVYTVCIAYVLVKRYGTRFD